MAIKPTYFGDSQFLAVAHARRHGRKIVWSRARGNEEPGYWALSYDEPPLSDADEEVIYDHSAWLQRTEARAS